MPIYLFSGSEDPVGQRLEGVRVLIDRYREAGIHQISHDFYAGGRHEMLNELNRSEVPARLLELMQSISAPMCDSACGVVPGTFRLP